MSIVFDANAFYAYYGREKLGLDSIAMIDEDKFIKEMNDIEKKYIATSSFIEILVRFKDEEKKLYRILKFIKQKKIGLFNNVMNETNYFSQKNFKHLLDNLNPSYLQKVAFLKIESKVYLESNYTILFILFILCSILLSEKNKIEITNYLLNNQKFDDLEAENKKDKIREILVTDFLERFFVSNIKKLTDELSQIIKDGYENGKVTSKYKNKVMEILEVYLLVFKNYIDGLNSIENNDFDFISAIDKNYQLLLDNKKNNHIIQMYSNMLKNEKFDFLSFENEINKRVKKTLSPSQTNYITNNLLKSWLENGAQIKKNDIYDTLLLSILDKSLISSKGKNLFLITFDKKIIKFIKNINISNWKFINKYLLVK